MLQRLRRFLRRKRPKIEVFTEPTEEHIRRAHELIEKHGWDHLRKK